MFAVLHSLASQASCCVLEGACGRRTGKQLRSLSYGLFTAFNDVVFTVAFNFSSHVQLRAGYTCERCYCYNTQGSAAYCLYLTRPVSRAEKLRCKNKMMSSGAIRRQILNLDAAKYCL